jgi:hypothetical protein
MSQEEQMFPRSSAALLMIAILLLAAAGCAAQPSQTPAAGESRTSNPTEIPSQSPIPGCLPACVTGRLKRPGPLSGDYTTQNFFGGQFTVTVPSGWEGFEDSTGELAIGPAGSEDGRVEFWIDVYAVEAASGSRDETVDITADAMAAWIASNPNLEILDRQPAMFGDLPAEAFDWLKRADAVNSVPDCPAELLPCVSLFGYPEWDGAFSEGGPARDRLVLAKATWGGTPHAIYALVWAVNEESFAEIQANAMQMIEGARLPYGVTAGS